MESATILVLTLSFIASCLLLLMPWKFLHLWKQPSRGCTWRPCQAPANVQKILQLLGAKEFMGLNAYLTSASWWTIPKQTHFLQLMEFKKYCSALGCRSYSSHSCIKHTGHTQRACSLAWSSHLIHKTP